MQMSTTNQFMSGEYPKRFVTGSHLTRLLKKNQKLIEGARPVLHKVFKRLALAEKAIVLCDKYGYIIDFVAEPNILQELFEHDIKLGVSLSNSSCGVTAVGNVLETGDLSVVNTEEHTWTACRPWSCIAAPVVVEGERLGIVCACR